MRQRTVTSNGFFVDPLLMLGSLDHQSQNYHVLQNTYNILIYAYISSKYIYIIMFTIINQHPWSFIKLTGARTYNGSPLAAHRCSTATSLVQKHLTYRTHWTTHWQNIPQGFLGGEFGLRATIRFLAIQSVYGYVYFQDMNTSIYIYVIINFWTSSKTKMQFWGIKSNGAHWILVEKAHSAQGDDFLEAWNGENEEAKHAVCMYTNIQKTIHMQSYVHFSISAFFAYLYYELYYKYIYIYISI